MKNTHHLAVEVSKENGYWDAFPIDAPGSASGATLFELFADGEFSKHFFLGVPKEVPVSLEYVPGQPEIAEELSAAYHAFLAMPEDVRPKVILWDHDNDRRLNAAAAPLINR
jgi:hypothetical protein